MQEHKRWEQEAAQNNHHRTWIQCDLYNRYHFVRLPNGTVDGLDEQHQDVKDSPGVAHVGLAGVLEAVTLTRMAWLAARPCSAAAP